MPIYTDEESGSNPHLPSFKSNLNKQRNFSSDLLQQALAAKSELGLSDSAKMNSDALQSLRSYGPQSQQDSPTKRQTPNPGFRQSFAPSQYLQNQRTQNESYRQEPQHGVQDQRFGTREGNLLRGMAQEHLENFYNSPRPRMDSQQTKSNVSEANPESFTPFRPLLQLNTVEDEDEFLYGDSTPLPETPKDSSRQENPASSKEGLGSWSDDEITILDDSSHHTRMSFDSPKKKSSKPTTSIPLKDLSWKSATAWKDENLYNRKTTNLEALNNSLKKVIDLNEDKRQENSTYHNQHDSTVYRSYDKGPPQPTSLPELLDEDSLRFPPEQMLTPQERKSKYAAAALLLRKQYNLDSSGMGSSPLQKAFESDMMGKKVHQAKEVIEKAMQPSAKAQHLPQLLINIEQGNNTTSKRVVSMSNITLQSSNIDLSRTASPLSIPNKREPEITERRIVRDISEQQEASAKARYLEDENKLQSDKFVKDLLERKRRSPDRYRSPEYDTRRRSPSPSYYRSRGRSRSPGPMYRSRSKPRVQERRSRRSRERSPRRRHQSRGRSPRHRSGERDLRSEPRKRPLSPEDSPHSRGDDKHPSKVPTLVAKANEKASKNEEAPVIKNSLLFPKSMSPEVRSQFMHNQSDRLKVTPKVVVASEASNDWYSAKLKEEFNFFVNDCTEEEKAVLKLHFVMKQVCQTDQLNQIVALKLETENIEKSLNKTVELQKSATTPYVASPVLPQTNMYSTPPPTLPSFPQSTPPMMPPYFPQINPPQALPMLQPFPQTYGHFNMPPYPPNLPPQYPEPPYGQPFNPAMPTSYNYPNPALSQPPPPILNQPSHFALSQPSHLYQPSPDHSLKVLNSSLSTSSQRCLRSVPVLPDTETPKIRESKQDVPKVGVTSTGVPKSKDSARGTAKSSTEFGAGFDEEKVIEIYQKRLEEKYLIQKKMKNLSKQSLEMKQMKEDFENKSRKVRTGNDKQFIAGFENLQEKSIRELHRYMEEGKRVEMEIQELQKRIRPENLVKLELKPKVVTAPQKSDVTYESYDTGKHWCVQCNVKCVSILEMVHHLHTPEHLQLEDPFRPVAGKQPPKIETNSSNCSLVPAKGLEFVRPLSAYYCSLCEETLLNPLFAEQHLKGHDHMVKYMNFLKENPMYEEKRDLVINTRAAAAAKENRMKELAEIAKARSMIIKNLKEKEIEKEQKKQSNSEKLQKVQTMLQKQQDSEGPLKELDEERSDAHDAPKKGSGIKVTLASSGKDKAKVENPLADKGKEEAVKPQPKRQVIYIGRAPNFKPKVGEKERKKEVWDKRNLLKDSLVKSDKNVSFEKSLVKEDKLKDSVAEAQKFMQAKQAEEIIQKTLIEQEVARAKEHVEKIAASFAKKDRDEFVPPAIASRKQRRSRFEESEKPDPCDEKNKKLCADRKDPESEKEAQTDKKKPVSVKIKLSGCKSEKEAMATQKNKREGSPSQKRGSKTLQLEMKEPNTDDPRVKQALKNIYYGTKDSAQDTNLSTIKLPEMPPPPPPSDLNPTRKKTLTEEEKDFLLLGINKSDMEPMAVPKRPPSVYSHAQTDVSAEVLPTEEIPPTNIQVPPPNLQIPLPNLKVPPPNLQVPPPNLQVPPPNLQVPPPNLQIPPLNLNVHPPNLQVPPPNLQVLPPNIQVPNVHIPPPNLQLPPPSLHIASPNPQFPSPNLLAPQQNVASPLTLAAPIAQNYSLHGSQSNIPVAPNHSTVLAPQGSTNSEVIDMEVDECEFESSIQAGGPQKLNSTTGNVSSKEATNAPKSSASERILNTKTVLKLKQDPTAHSQAVAIVVAKKDADGFGHDSGHIKGSLSIVGSKEDKLACTDVLNEVINTILESYTDKPSEGELGRDVISTSSANEEIRINSEDSSTELMNSPASVSSRLSSASCSASTEPTADILLSEPKVSIDTEDCAVKIVTTEENNTPLISPSVANVSASVPDVATSDSQTNVLDFMDSSVSSENNSSLENESLPPNMETPLMCDSNVGKASLKNDAPSALSSDIISDKVDETINIDEDNQNVTSQLVLDPQFKCAEPKEQEDSILVFSDHTNVDQTVKEDSLLSVETPSVSQQEAVPLIKVPGVSEVSISSPLVPKIPEASFKSIDEEDDCNSPLIHSLEHFIDELVDTSLQETNTETSLPSSDSLVTSNLSTPEMDLNESCNSEKRISIPNQDSLSGVAPNAPDAVSSLESPPAVDKTEQPPNENKEFCCNSSENLVPADSVEDLQPTETSVTDKQDSLVSSNVIGSTEQCPMDVEFSKKDIKIEDILGKGYSFDSPQIPITPSTSEQNTDVPVAQPQKIQIKTEKSVEKEDFFTISTHPKRLSVEPIAGAKVKKSLSLTEEVENASQQPMDIDLVQFPIKTEETTEPVDFGFSQKPTQIEETRKSSNIAQRNIKIEDTAIIEDLFNNVPTVSPMHGQCTGITKKQTVYEIIDLEEEITVKKEIVESDSVEKGAAKEDRLSEKKDDSDDLVITTVKSKEDKKKKSLIFVDLASSDDDESNVPPPLAPAKKKEPEVKQDKKIIKDKNTAKSSSYELLVLSDDSNSVDTTNAAVPCLDKFDLDDSLSNSIAEFPPVLSEASGNKAAPDLENSCQVTAETSEKTVEKNIQGKIKRSAQNLASQSENKESETLQKGKVADSDTDEYETEDGKE